MNHYVTITGYGMNMDEVRIDKISMEALRNILAFAPKFKAWLEEIGHYPQKQGANADMTVADWLETLDDAYPDDMNRMGISRILHAALNEHAAALGYGEDFFDSMKENETDNTYILYVQRFPWDISNALEKTLTPEKLDADLFAPVLDTIGISNAADLLDVWCIEVG